MLSILLACYNGEAYLSQQIDSILSQTNQEFCLYINDDASTDGTYQIALEYAKNYPQKIFASCNEMNSGSSKYNFMQMMQAHQDDYVMLCDQDDVWFPYKIQKTLEQMHLLEKKYGKKTPVLVHTDLQVVNQNLQVLDASYRHMVNANYKRTALHYELVQNTVTGCTALYNKALANLLVRAPHFFVMHDWWIALIASAFGVISDVEEATMLYRQHENNSIGAKPVRSLPYLLKRLLQQNEFKEAVEQTYLQAEAFYKVFFDKLSEKQKELVLQYSKLPQKQKLQKWETLCRLKTVKYSVVKKAAQFLFI